MFSKVSITGMITTIFDPNPDTKTQFMTVKVLQTVLVDSAPVQQYAEVVLQLSEGYEKYTGHIELGDIVSASGRLLVAENGGPIFSDNDGLPKFVLVTYSTAVLAHGGQQTGMDKFEAIIIGNLGKDPEMRFTEGGKAVTNINVAISRKHTVKGAKVSETTWFRVSFWDKLAETVNEYLHKGSRIMVEGHMQYDPKTHGPKSYEKTTPGGGLGSSFEITGKGMTMLSPSGGGGTHEPMGNIPEQDDDLPEDPTESKAVDTSKSAVSKAIPF